MIHLHEGNFLDVPQGILVHGCNCQGRMGAGIALAIKNKWPAVYDAYKSHEARSGLMLGDIVAITNDIHPFPGVRYEDPSIPLNVIIVNAMTQFDSGGGDTLYVDYDAVAAAFYRVKILAKESDLSVHVPLIGCGLANGEWEIVSNIIETVLGPEIEKHLWILPGTKITN